MILKQVMLLSEILKLLVKLQIEFQKKLRIDIMKLTGIELEVLEIE